MSETEDEKRVWEKFDGGPFKRAHGVRVTINWKGQIYMSERAYQIFGRPKAVILYYDRVAEAIALQTAYPKYTQNFRVNKKQCGWVINASPFCRHHKISVPNTERFARPDLDEKRRLILSLRETVTVGGFNRNKMRRGEVC